MIFISLVVLTLPIVAIINPGIIKTNDEKSENE
jgi:hypothetical protein